MAEVANFPTRPRLLIRLGLCRDESGRDLAALDAELRRIDASISALSARRAEVLALYRREFKKHLA
jgi:hypothetical protein